MLGRWARPWATAWEKHFNFHLITVVIISLTGRVSYSWKSCNLLPSQPWWAACVFCVTESVQKAHDGGQPTLTACLQLIFQINKWKEVRSIYFWKWPRARWECGCQFWGRGTELLSADHVLWGGTWAQSSAASSCRLSLPATAAVSLFSPTEHWGHTPQTSEQAEETSLYS